MTIMAEVKILLEGYTSEDKVNGSDEMEHTRPTMTLVRDGDVRIVVDPGVMVDVNELVDALAAEDLAPEDVTHIFLTHSHIDHFRNLGLFPRATVVEYYGAWQGDVCDDRPKQLTSDILIEETPGHSSESLSLFVNTDQGVVVVCGDVFWKESGPDHDPYAEDMDQLRKTRQKVLERADWVIPGHGPMFPTTK